ncbi:MAG: fatty acid desaturase [Myxococcota bacterium]
MLVEAAVCIAVVALTLTFWHPLTVALAMIVLATRQHAQFILFHDAVHYNVARDRRLNDFLTNLVIGVPQLVPVQLYRRLHLAHHARLGTPADPERLLLYRRQPWRYRPLGAWPLARQLAGDLFLVNNVRTLVGFGQELRDPKSLLSLPPARTWPEFYATVGFYLGALVAWAALDPSSLGRFALIWFVPLLTLTQAIQKVRSFAEHAAADAPELSYSWRPGLFGRLVLWPYHINYHREHHVHPRVPWYRLPATFPDVEQRPGRELPRLLWNGRR